MYFSTLPEVLGNDGAKVLTVPVSETEKIAGSPGFVTVYCVYNSRWVSTATPIGVFTETEVEEAGITTPRTKRNVPALPPRFRGLGIPLVRLPCSAVADRSDRSRSAQTGPQSIRSPVTFISLYRESFVAARTRKARLDRAREGSRGMGAGGSPP